MKLVTRSNSKMYKRTIIIIFLLSTLISSKPVYAQEASGPVYIVQSGDSLSSIAEFFSVSINELMSANGISDPNQLDAGQQLIIPGLEGVTGILNVEVVNFGDSFRSLVRRTQVSQAIFKKLNHVISPSQFYVCLLYTSPSPRDRTRSRMPSSA